MSSFTIIAFYHFFSFPEFEEKRAGLLEFMKAHAIKGSILLASEGINGTVAGSGENIAALIAYLKNDIIHGDFDYKESAAEKAPFPRTKVRLKKETISLGVPTNPHDVGQYVEAKDWNALICDPDTIVLDSRNSYEVHIGTFKNAINPNTKNFKELPQFVQENLSDKKNKKIATFCTGGIRCEKLTSWLKTEGFGQVYHLKGGILKYLEEIPKEESCWEGECYVFDKRVAVGHGLAPSTTASMCIACGHALLPSDRESPLYSEDISCPYCAEVN